MSDIAFTQLLRKMAHDMRVPLNTLISTSEMLSEGIYDPLTPKQTKAATRLQRNSHRLLAILDDFVIYMKAISRDLEINPKPFDPRGKLDLWTTQVRKAADEKGLALEVTFLDAVPAALVGDEASVSRIISALLWNAVSFTEAGRIQVMSDWSPEQGWLMTVEDSGSGISDEALPHIFEPFWRGEERPQTLTAGAGLGLPMAQALAELMGGSLVLKQTGSTGSVFETRLPLAKET